MVNKYRITIHLQDSKGWKWGESVCLWALSYGSAENGAKLYTDYLNQRNGAYDNGEVVTSYKVSKEY